MIPLFSNLLALRRHHPTIAARLDTCPDRDSVISFNTPDGGIAYGLKREASITPLTDPTAPLSRIGAQLDRFATDLSNFTKPVLLVGLNPGDELLHIFDLAEKHPPPHATQPIHVCIDSIHCLHAFLSTFDATRVLSSPRVHFFYLDEIQTHVDQFRSHPEWPHLFTPISGSLNGSVSKVATAFGALVQERDAEYKSLIAENNAYYDAISDEDLAAVISNHLSVIGNQSGKDSPSTSPSSTPSTENGSLNTDHSRKRAPRLLLPTSSWSTVTQYAARDLADMLRAAGWDVLHLNMDSMMTPYLMARTIHDFKPDVLLFINHLRTEAIEVYPRNLLFVTWIQDTVPHVNNRETAANWARLALWAD